MNDLGLISILFGGFVLVSLRIIRNRRMKRSFHTLDQSIPEEIWVDFPLEKKHVTLSSTLEDSSERMLMHRWRTAYSAASENKIITKPVRVFLRHEYVLNNVVTQVSLYVRYSVV